MHSAIECRRLKDKLKGDIDVDKYLTLMIDFSYEAVAMYGQENTGKIHSYDTLLSKQTNPNQSKDCGVWHYHGDFPLHQLQDDGSPLIRYEWLQITT